MRVKSDHVPEWLKMRRRRRRRRRMSRRMRDWEYDSTGVREVSSFVLFFFINFYKMVELSQST